MTQPPGHAFLNTPGPTPVPERVLRAMNRQAIDFNQPDFIALAVGCFAALRRVFGTAGEVFVYTASGHGGWEGALVNTLSPGDLVLVPESGVFSNAWASMARSFGVEVELMPGDWRRAVDPAAIEARLAEDQEHRIAALLVVHTDTASSVTCDPPALRRALDATGHPALLMVDAVASLATTEFRMDEWGIDVAVAASQKGLMTPPGLAFVAAGEKARKAAQRAQLPRNYWDWEARRGEAFYSWFCGTPALHLLYGLAEALTMLEEEGLEAAFARHRRLAGAVHAAVEAWSQGGALDFNAVVPAERAVSVTTLRLSGEPIGERVRRLARERYAVALGGGLRRLQGQTFRIGHMGYQNEAMILGTLGAVELALRELGLPLGENALARAIDRLAE